MPLSQATPPVDSGNQPVDPVASPIADESIAGGASSSAAGSAAGGEIDSGFESESEESFDSMFSAAVAEATATTDTASQPADSVAAEPAAQPPAQPAEQPPAQPPAQPAEPQISDSMRTLLSEATTLGIRTDGMQSEAELAQAVLSQLRESQPYVQFARQLVPYADQVRDTILAGNAAPAKPEPQASPQESGQAQPGEWDQDTYWQEQYGGPTWKPEYQRAVEAGMVSRDPNTGNWTAAPGQELIVGSVLAEMNAARQHSNRFWQEMSQTNPLQKIYGAFKAPMEREIDQRIEQYFAKREQQTQSQDSLTRFETENESWLYSVDPATGEKVLSDTGAKFADTVDQLKSAGVSDVGTLLKIASQLTGSGQPAPVQPVPSQAAPPQPAPVQPAPVQPVPTQQAPPPAVPQQDAQQASFLDNARRRAAHSPSAAQPSEFGESPQVISEGDLDSTFSREFRALQAG